MFGYFVKEGKKKRRKRGIRMNICKCSECDSIFLKEVQKIRIENIYSTDTDVGQQQLLLL